MSWIKLREDLADDPAVELIASRCGVTACHAVGALARAWTWAGRLSYDGTVPLGTPDLLDKITQTPGLARSMEAAGWLEVGSTYLLFPKWDRHNDAGAKARSLAAERQRRKRVTPGRDQGVTVGRDQRRGEEKREEESVVSDPAATPRVGPQPLSRKPPRKVPETFHAQAIDWYVSEVERRCGFRPGVNGKGGKAVQAIAKSIGSDLEEFRRVATAYFEDDWHRDKGYDLGKLASAFDGIRASLSAKRKSVSEECPLPWAHEEEQRLRSGT